MTNSKTLAQMLVLCSVCTMLDAQEPTAAQGEQQEAMSKLKPLIGKWKGGGWIAVGEKRYEFESYEDIRSLAGGLAIMLEGRHHMTTNDGKKREIHNAAGMINYNAKSNRFRFATQLASGQAGDYSAILTDRGDFQWTIPETPAGTMVYTISFQKEGRYREVGELVSGDGERKKFFEMNLKKVK